jgi:GNAT superfamily N-acetyltransferase
MSGVEVRPLTATEIGPALDALARLRIAVFRAFPYLYEGDEAYERDYLAEFAAAPDAVLVAAFSEAGDIVGAATASPMRAQKAVFQQPFVARGWDVDRLFYFGESVLLPEWRGQGIGHAFFDHREANARTSGATAATFAAVIRADDHASCPVDHTPLDPFWRARGYTPVDGFITDFEWTDIGATEPSAKPMQYWMRSL